SAAALAGAAHTGAAAKWWHGDVPAKWGDGDVPRGPTPMGGSYSTEESRPPAAPGDVPRGPAPMGGSYSAEESRPPAAPAAVVGSPGPAARVLPGSAGHSAAAEDWRAAADPAPGG